MKVSRKPLTGEKTHPTQPELVFTFRKPDALTLEGLVALFTRNRRVVAIQGPDGKPLEVEKDGVVSHETQVIIDAKPETILEAIWEFIDDLRGLEDEDGGAPIAYKTGKNGKPVSKIEQLAILRLLARADLAVTLSAQRAIVGPDGKQRRDGNGELAWQTKLSVFDWIIETGSDPETYGISSGKG